MENVRNPELMDVLDAHKKDIGLSLNCHALATIQSFDAATQTCRATINYTKTVSQTAPNGKVISVPKPYPILVNVPIISLFGGVAGVTFPIKKGDTCVILFNDRDIDNWFISGDTNAETVTKRTHSLSDGLALVGVRSKKNALSNYDTSNLVLFHGANKITVSESNIVIEKGPVKITVGDKVKIENATGSLLPILNELVVDLLSLPSSYNTTTPGNPIAPGPGTAPILTNINVNLTKLQGLLE